jgi:hypothetical protein
MTTLRSVWVAAAAWPVSVKVIMPRAYRKDGAVAGVTEIAQIWRLAGRMAPSGCVEIGNLYVSDQLAGSRRTHCHAKALQLWRP